MQWSGWSPFVLWVFESSNSFYRVFWDCSKRTIYNSYHFMLFLVLWRSLCIISLFVFLLFLHWVSPRRKGSQLGKLYFFLLSQSLVFSTVSGELFVSENSRGHCSSHSLGWILDCGNSSGSYGQTNFLYNSQWITFPTESCRYHYSLIRAFYISVSEWFFTGVWVTACLLKSPGLFLVFWPFWTMLSFGWSPLVRQLPSLLVPLAIL